MATSDRYLMNRLGNCKNEYQGSYMRVLCVCSAGLLRSPTAALVLSQEPYNFNTRACGIVSDYALIPIDRVLITWAELIICMSWEQSEKVKDMLKELSMDRDVISLDIPDQFPYRDKELIEAIKQGYAKSMGLKNDNQTTSS